MHPPGKSAVFHLKHRSHFGEKKSHFSSRWTNSLMNYYTFQTPYPLYMNFRLLSDPLSRIVTYSNLFYWNVLNEIGSYQEPMNLFWSYCKTIIIYFLHDVSNNQNTPYNNNNGCLVVISVEFSSHSKASIPSYQNTFQIACH